MKVVHIKTADQRDAYLARLCAEVYGHDAGLAPLVSFVGTRRELFVHEAARLLALVDERDHPQALALLVLDEAGIGMTVTLSCSLHDDSQSPDASHRLISDLALKAPLRVEARDQQEEMFYRSCGITRWYAGRGGVRIGLGGRHPASSLDELTDTLSIDEQAILRRFKHDPKGFEEEKQRFVEGLTAFEGLSWQ
ncbi:MULTISPECIES: hypothetical protein [Halomonadaceae]|uniref:hypothetical protein n=1 Tax=Halomonadaceae TaxID=28256 RepID=UPI00159A3C22|nr:MULTISPECIES: hypothetical protein [Halomonas]QJQ94888.1 hypothetical protein HIO72_06080 [Halomonas sp. PA5]